MTFRKRTVTGMAQSFIAPREANRVPVPFNLQSVIPEKNFGPLSRDNQDEWSEGTLNIWQHWNPASKELEFNRSA